MEWFVKAFIKASLAWLALGVTLGVAMAAHSGYLAYRPAHLHMNLLGFVTMMIYGVAYHVVPRFSGHPLHSRPLAAWHWWLSNVGLAGMVAGFMMRPHVSTASASRHVLSWGGVLSAVGAYVFVYVMWRTIDGSRALRAARQRVREARGASLPVAQG